MSIRTSRLREFVLADIVASRERATEWWDTFIAECGGINRLVDYYLTYDIASALRTIYVGRYGHSERVRMAIKAARVALDELAEALRAEGAPAARTQPVSEEPPAILDGNGGDTE